jgi:hypothetical protein
MQRIIERSRNFTSARAGRGRLAREPGEAAFLQPEHFTPYTRRPCRSKIPLKVSFEPDKVSQDQ